MSKSIEAIEGIGQVYGDKLRSIGCITPQKFLQLGATPSGRKSIAEKSGIDPKVILRCVNMADLFRIRGVATRYAELLEASGVDTVKELKHRRADNLTAKMAEVNKEKKLVQSLPNEKMVTHWIEQAKTLPPMVTY